jgi:hypothetical protein
MCFSCYDKWQYHKNPEAKAKKHKEWASKNQAHLRQYSAEWRRQNPLKKVFVSLRGNAKKRGIPFSLTEEDLKAVWTEVCPVFGVPLQLNTVRQNNSLSVDRIDNSVGYVPGNICVMSWRANRLKTDATVEELEAVVNFMKLHSPSNK